MTQERRINTSTEEGDASPTFASLMFFTDDQVVSLICSQHELVPLLLTTSSDKEEEEESVQSLVLPLFAASIKSDFKTERGSCSESSFLLSIFSFL